MWDLYEKLEHWVYIPKKVYKFNLLNKFVKVMSFEEEPGTIFTEEQLRLDSNYMELNSDIFRLESFYNYLDSMYVSGNSNRAIDLVMFGIHRLNINILMNIHKFHTPKKAHQLPVHYDCNKFQIKLCIPSSICCLIINYNCNFISCL